MATRRSRWFVLSKMTVFSLHQINDSPFSFCHMIKLQLWLSLEIKEGLCVTRSQVYGNKACHALKIKYNTSNTNFTTPWCRWWKVWSCKITRIKLKNILLWFTGQQCKKYSFVLFFVFFLFLQLSLIINRHAIRSAGRARDDAWKALINKILDKYVCQVKPLPPYERL